MTIRIYNVIVFCLIFGSTLAAQTRIKFERVAPFEQEFIIPSDSVGIVFQLPDSFIIAETDSVWLDSTLLSKQTDYLADLIPGRLIFKKTLEPGKQVRIKYHFFPVKLRPLYFHQWLTQLPTPNDSLEENITVIERFQAPAQDVPLIAGSELQKSGSIVRGISVGSNQGLKLDSGLRMQLSGRIANKVDVIAALTDQNTPIQPEGNTQTLQEIDKVYVQIKSDYFQATLGDYQMNYENGEFGRYSRKLQGVMGTLTLKNTAVTLSGAISKGQYTSNQFMGREGNQGPYQLKGEQGQTDIIVIAGTEKVWIDGELMTRGETNDYIIEYGNGQITFTRNRLITEESRITVDFQYSDQKFRRNLYTGRVTTGFFENKINLTTSIIHEADDKSNPLDFTLSESNLNQLQQAGDKMDSAYVSSATLVGENRGAYVRVDSGTVTFYRYVGEGKGPYRVNFSFVGYGNGDYQLKGFGNYRYVGPAKGSYLPKVLLYPARRHDLVHLNLQASPFSWFSLNNEFALSNLDQNTYSAIDDADNQGFAYKFQLTLNPQPLPKIGRFKFNGRFRYVNPRFQSIDRTTEVEYNRRWDLGTNQTIQEQVTELNGVYQPLQHLEFQSTVGNISKGNRFQSQRYDFASQLTVPRWPMGRFRRESISSHDQLRERRGEWLRQRGNLSYQFWKLLPGLGFEQEIKKDLFADTSYSTGFRFDEFTGKLAINPGAKINFLTSVSQREDKQWDGLVFQPQSVALTQQYQLELAQIKALSAAVNYTHRDKRYQNQANDKKTDLAELRVNFNPFRRAIHSSWHYQISNTQTTRRERQYLEVPAGEGNYRYDADLKEFVPDPLGKYEIRVVNTNIFIPVIDLRTSLNLKINFNTLFGRQSPPARPVKSASKNTSKPLEAFNFLDLVKMIPWRKMLTNLSSESMLRIEEKTKEDAVWEIYRLNLDRFQSDSTIYGTLFFRQYLYYGKNNRAFSLRLHFEQDRTTNRQYIEGGETRLHIERSLQVTTNLSERVSAQLRLQNQRKRRLFSIPGRENRDIKSQEFTADFSFRPSARLELALKGRLTRDVDEYPETPTTAALTSLTPRLNYAFRSKGRLSAQFEWSQVKASRDFLPYEMVNGNAVGLSQRWQVSFNYRISKNVQGSLNYNGRNEERRGGLIHIGRAEVRAFF